MGRWLFAVNEDFTIFMTGRNKQRTKKKKGMSFKLFSKINSKKNELLFCEAPLNFSYF
ncbi:hypothetical protein RV13_GL001804 [Enterococcus raffinosus]|nr:hypothetical protein RV13_GL001804 [Enterococcus raffinosus]